MLALELTAVFPLEFAVQEITSVEFAALLPIAIAPEAGLDEAGAKETVTVVLWPGDKIIPVEIPPNVSEDPDKLMPEMAMLALPESERVKVCRPMEPRLIRPKFSAEELTESVDAWGAGWEDGDDWEF